MTLQQKRQNGDNKNETHIKDTEEKNLESLLFGGSDDMWETAGREHEYDPEALEEQYDSVSATSDYEEDAFFLDAGPTFEPATAADDNETDNEISELDQQEDGEKNIESSDEEDHLDQALEQQGAAWKDSDDENILISLNSTSRLRKLRKHKDEDMINGTEYQRRLRKQFNKMYPRPEWAVPPSLRKLHKKGDNSDMDDSDQGDDEQLKDADRLDLLKSTLGILEKRKTSAILSPDFVNIVRVKDANIMDRSSDKITAVQFHPNAQVLLTAGFDRKLRLFQIDGKVNHKIQSVFFQEMPIYAAQFHTSGDQIVVTGRRPYMYFYDIQSGAVDKSPGIWGREEKSWETFSISPCGRYIAFAGNNGEIVLVSFLTKQWIGVVRMNGRVSCLSWSADGNHLYSSGSDGEVYQWDVGQRECIHRWVDDGSLGTTSIAVCPNEKYYATGSTSGVVNVYNDSVLSKESNKPAPYKSFGNLTTQITDMKFNYDSQLLAIASSSKKDSLKLIHTPTGRVVKNWPTERTPLNCVTAMNFSPNSDYFAFGTKRGRVLLYNIKDYSITTK